jgi:hypothetical protein
MAFPPEFLVAATLLSSECQQPSCIQVPDECCIFIAGSDSEYNPDDYQVERNNMP